MAVADSADTEKLLPAGISNEPDTPQHKRSAFITTLITVFYVAFNILAAVSIVFANKMVMSVYRWQYVYALTFLHTSTSWAGMGVFASLNMYKKKVLPKLRVLPLAGAYVGYVVLNNLSLQINSVSFYQLTKICIAPVVLLMEVLMLGKKTTARIVCSVAVVCCGVFMATVMDKQMENSTLGVIIGVVTIFVTATYQIWVGTFQRSLEATSMQLLDQYCPLAAVGLAVTTVIVEPWGFANPTPTTILGFPYSISSLVFLGLSCVLGLAVNLSTFLVIGATSSLTYNIVGHIKTVLILTGGFVFFSDTMSREKFLGVCIAMAGIVWYSLLTMQQAQAAPPTSKPVTPAPNSGAANGLTTATLTNVRLRTLDVPDGKK